MEVDSRNKFRPTELSYDYILQTYFIEFQQQLEDIYGHSFDAERKKRTNEDFYYLCNESPGIVKEKYLNSFCRVMKFKEQIKKRLSLKIITHVKSKKDSLDKLGCSFNEIQDFTLASTKDNEKLTLNSMFYRRLLRSLSFVTSSFELQKFMISPSQLCKLLSCSIRIKKVVFTDCEIQCTLPSCHYVFKFPKCLNTKSIEFTFCTFKKKQYHRALPQVSHLIQGFVRAMEKIQGKTLAITFTNDDPNETSRVFSNTSIQALLEISKLKVEDDYLCTTFTINP
ncbi:unnamed protein product [Moneuplotes crassus]|uniref:Uncharacterized protein n=1 Tax=Euplotes crassus TaxID=5936 RepID=A0AAD2D310_EUPCR|nr:unnamed protein product [Moneuplotes crassus]